MSSSTKDRTEDDMVLAMSKLLDPLGTAVYAASAMLHHYVEDDCENLTGEVALTVARAVTASFETTCHQLFDLARKA